MHGTLFGVFLNLSRKTKSRFAYGLLLAFLLFANFTGGVQARGDERIQGVFASTGSNFAARQNHTTSSLTVSGAYYMDNVRTTLSQNPSNRTLYISNSSGFVAGDEVLIIIMQGVMAGQYETGYVDTVFADRLELTADLDLDYDTALGSIMVQKIPHFGAVTVESGGNITAHTWNGATGGVVFFRADSVTVASGGKIDVSGLGYRGGGIATSGEGLGGGAGGISLYWDGTGGGGGSYGGSGYQGHRGSYTGGRFDAWGALPGSIYGEATLGRINLGSGGGGGGSNTAPWNGWKVGQPGQAGGGIIYFEAQFVEVDGHILSNGLDATAKSTCGNMDNGGGGGGSGGTIFIKSSSIAIKPPALVSAVGGIGNINPNSICDYGWTGGQGGHGRIRLDYSFLSGTTTPPPDYSQVTSGSLSTISASTPAAPADGTTPITITVTVFDTAHTPIPNANVTLQTTGSASIVQLSNSTDDLGKTTGQIINSVAEAVTVSALVNGVLLEDTVDVTFNTAPAGDLMLSMTGLENAVAYSPLSYTITITQSGGVPAEDVTLELQLPADVAYKNQNSPVTPTQTGQILAWIFGTFTPGQSLSFVVNGDISNTAGVGAELTAQISSATSSNDGTLSNNSASVTTTIVDGHSSSVFIEPVSMVSNVDVPSVYKIKIENAGLLPDKYAISVGPELDPSWYSLSETSVSLVPGEIRWVNLVVDLSAQANKCEIQNVSIPVSVKNSSGEEQSANAQLLLQSGPVVTDLYPTDNASLGTNDVLFSWKTDAESTGVLHIRPLGEIETDTYPTTSSKVHSITVPDLVRETIYEWYVEATSDCGTTTTPIQQFAVDKGVVFELHNLSYEIPRDYDQTVRVSIVNQDSASRNVQLKIEHTYEDLIVNFRGSGSIDEDVHLLRNGKYDVELAFFAQDTEREDYYITAVLTSTDENGNDMVTDTAVIHVKVLFPDNYTVDVISTDPVTNATMYRLTNNGLPITDLSVRAEDPDTGLPASVMIVPQISHARVDTHEHLDFKVFPLYGPEHISNISNLSGIFQGGLARPSKDLTGNIPFNLATFVGDTARRMLAQKSCDKNVYALTFNGPVSMALPYNTWYCPNTPHVKIPLFTPPFIDTSNLLGGLLQMNFSPASITESHNVNILLNGTTIGGMQNMIPSGIYSFNAEPSSFNTGLLTSAQQIVEIDANFRNFAHYQIGTGGDLTVFLDTVTVYVCANSLEEARLIAGQLYGLTSVPNTMNVQIELPDAASDISLGEDGMVDVRVRVTDNISTYSNVYSVTAVVEYLDMILTPTDTFTLFDDGEAGHGDAQANDRYFNAQWLPRYGGNMRLTVTATTGYGLSDLDTRTYLINAQPDFELKRVFIEKIAREGEAVEVLAEIVNNGFDVAGPIPVEFRYYSVNENGEKVGAPIFVSQISIFDGVLDPTFNHGETIKVKDTAFVAPAVALYYVEVVVDP